MVRRALSESAVDIGSDPEEKETVHGITHRDTSVELRRPARSPGAEYLESLRGPREMNVRRAGGGGRGLAWRHLFWGLRGHGTCPIPWAGGAMLPNPGYAAAYRVFATVAYPRIKEIIENTVTSGLIYIPAHAVDFQTSALRPYLDKYMRGSDGSSVRTR